MRYYIVKDCGAGWDDWLKSESADWGVSKSQKPLACKVAQGDVMLHYIDHVNAWSGYSEVIGALMDNTRDENRDWRVALPWVVPLRRVINLNKQQCMLTRNLIRIRDRHRQRAFTTVPETEAHVIIEAIKAAEKSAGQAEDQEFNEQWGQGADDYYGSIQKEKAGYKCEVCGADGIAWAKKYLGGLLRKGDEDSEPDWFLEAAHIVPRCKNGPATPDNLRAVCGNCHHLIDRLPDDEKTAYLKSLPSSLWRQRTSS